MHGMRIYVAAAMAAVGSVALAAGALGAQGDVIQTFDAKTKPKRAPKSDFRGVGLHVDVAGCFEGPNGDCDPNANPSGPDAKRAVFQFATRRYIAFDTSEARRCKVAGPANQQADTLANLNTQQAKRACGRKSVIGDGDAQADAGGTKIPAEVTAFNGKPKRGFATILLHAYAESFQTGTVPVGTLKRRNKLDVRIDPLVSGAARLEEFDVDIRKGDYVQLSCPTKMVRFKSRWFYRDAPGVTVNDKQPCRQQRR